MSKSAKKIESLADLRSDPRNARKHGERNIGMLAKSLEDYGAARSIVISEDGEIIAGHGVVEAAASVGIEKVTPVEASGNEIIAVVRRGLTPQQKAELAIADNRASDLSEFDAATLKALSDESLVDLDKFFFPNELEQMFAAEITAAQQGEQAEPERSDGGSQPAKYQIVVECEDAVHQAEVLESLKRKGLKCRVLA